MNVRTAAAGLAVTGVFLAAVPASAHGRAVHVDAVAGPSGTVSSVVAMCSSETKGGYKRLKVVAGFKGIDPSWHGFIDITNVAERVPNDGENYNFSGLHAALAFTSDSKGNVKVDGVADTAYFGDPPATLFKAGARYNLYVSEASIEQPSAVLKKIVTVSACHAFAKAPKPTINGTVQVGHRVKAVVGRFSPAARIGYQWLINGKPIAHATRATFTIAKRDAGRRLSVRVVASRTDYRSVSRTSRSRLVRP